MYLILHNNKAVRMPSMNMLLNELEEHEGGGGKQFYLPFVGSLSFNNNKVFVHHFFAGL